MSIKQNIEFIKENKEKNYPIYLDSIFPFHTLLQTNEDFDGTINTKQQIPATYNYFKNKKINFLNLCNNHYNKYLSTTDVKKLIIMKNDYCKVVCLSYIIGFSSFLLFSKSYYQRKVFTYFYLYMSCNFIYSAQAYGIAYINKDILKLNKKLIKNYKNQKYINERYFDRIPIKLVLDNTLIDDWKSYLIYYNLL